MRISAENMYGISDPLDSEEMKAKDLFSMSLLVFLLQKPPFFSKIA